MELLDADNNPLFSKRLGKYSSRDIVQFVPYRDLRNDPYRLAKEVLAEVPRQMTSYFQARGMRPNPKKFADRQALFIQQQMQQKMKAMMHRPDSFFAMRKQMMINHLATQGYDAGALGNFLDQHGICDESTHWAMNMSVPGYINKMRMWSALGEKEKFIELIKVEKLIYFIKISKV